MTKIERIFERYKVMGEFISRCFGSNVEVVLHDLRDFEHSGVKIYNSYISGRSDGAPMTEFGLNLLESKIYEKENFITNYKGVTGGKILRSSTLFIKDEKENLIGMLCVNVDITKYLSMSKELESLAYFGLDENKIEKSKMIADFPKSVKDMINTSLSNYISNNGYDWQRLNKDEKIDMIKKLNDKGIFTLRGGISEVSEALKISEPTIYRYLCEVRKNKK